ncbi:MAG: enoyl-CoA hydratase/isomerase family protein, partial [Actinobacteria bacterium]|nr:enoyl-CoA hydratase/isomerase family protein [Actinomycetota bacterium]
MAEAMAARAEDVATADGVIRVITLQDQDRRNTFTPDMIASLGEEIARAERDEQVGAVVLTHTGRVFCAGTDLNHLVSIAGDAARARAFLTELVGLIRRLERLPKFTVAAIEGPAVGGGFELALACDVRVLGADAWVRLPEVTLGAVPGGGGVQRLTRFAGRGRTARAVLLAERLGARAC